MSDAAPSPADRDLTAVANLIDDPARAAMLAALAGDRALPAGEWPGAPAYVPVQLPRTYAG